MCIFIALLIMVQTYFSCVLSTQLLERVLAFFTIDVRKSRRKKYGRHLGPVSRSVQCNVFAWNIEVSAHLINHNSMKTELISQVLFFLHMSYM